MERLQLEMSTQLEEARYGIIVASFTFEHSGVTSTLHMTRQDAERRPSLTRA